MASLQDSSPLATNRHCVTTFFLLLAFLIRLEAPFQKPLQRRSERGHVPNATTLPGGTNYGESKCKRGERFECYICTQGFQVEGALQIPSADQASCRGF